uniref:LAGLIDADG endonuclease n=1 Tax=Pertusaria propinqua TaxID=2283411 RepID=A0A345K5U1_9LECA|nr:LAGLIDADG endonuclease [Pertusaria propinqua]AXH38233.1 LAGLIDADG endonuclease [Pertusaria propinqua]QBP39456.1 LAGLIDADG endonuclease [Pertusaria propinqua]
MNIPIKYPASITINSTWFAGFFDADGTITYSIKNNYPQLTISVTNKLLIDVINYKHVFKGNVYFDKGQNGYYKWSIQSKADIDYFKTYLLKYPCKSKKKRFFFINKYYELKYLKAYCALPDNARAKAWANFNNKWNNIG